MAFMLYSIDEAVDCKYIVIKSMREQVKKGTLIHIMDARESSDGITVYYRVTKTKQDYMVKFDTVKQFCNWCMPSTFLAKYYDKLSSREILRYIKVENRSFMTFHLPVIITCLLLLWAAVGVLIFLDPLNIDMMLLLIAGGVLSVLLIVAVFIINHFSKEHMTERLYKKVSST